MTLSFGVILSCIIGTLCHHINLDGQDWTLSNGNDTLSHQSTVPSDIYTELMKSGVLVGDPYYKNNDVKWRWVAMQNWTLSKEFQVAESVLRSAARWVLVAEGIDTVSVVTLNDRIVGRTSNMFIRYEFNVSGIIKAGLNTLVVRFTSPVSYARAQAKTYAYPVPPPCVPALFHGECHANFVRKEQRSFGWDLGPAFPTMGIWKSIGIQSRDDCSILDVMIHVEKGTSGGWSVDGKVHLTEGGPPLCQGLIHVRIEELAITYSNVYRAETYVKFRLMTDSQLEPELWWPNGWGRARLYNLTVALLTSEGRVQSTRTVRVGFRTVRLVQNVTRGMAGLSFQFVVNGRAVFAKGANYVPSDCLQGRVTDARLRFLLRSARDAGMNMIRVWGGGIYERSSFYGLADEFGLMVWQDMMFAGTMYPVHRPFLASVDTEVKQQIRRLQHHASIVVWAANSENEEFLANNTFGTQTNFSLYKSDYIKLYVDTVMARIRMEDPDRPLLSSTQSNGVHTRKAGWVAKDPNSQIYGDVHFYRYYGNVWDWRVYPVAKFASEYGFQSLPSFYTLLNVSGPEDWDVAAEFWTHRQHHANGMNELRDCAKVLFQLPNSTNPIKRFRHYLYLYQVNQAMVVKIETENYRISRDRIMAATYRGGTMGALYWQLNDIWPAPSWGSIDSSGRWKLLHYYARNFFNTTLVCAQPAFEGDALDVYVILDRLDLANTRAPRRRWASQRSWGPSYHPNHVYSMRQDSPFTLRLNFYQWWQLGRPTVVTIPVHVDPSRHSQLVHRHHFASAGCHSDGPGCLVTIEFRREDQLLSENFLLSTAPRNFTDYLYRPDLQVTTIEEASPDVFTITLTTQHIALFVTLETSIDGTFSENGFHMTTRERTIRFESRQSVSVNRLRNSLEIFTLWDLYHER